MGNAGFKVRVELNVGQEVGMLEQAHLFCKRQSRLCYGPLANSSLHIAYSKRTDIISFNFFTAETFEFTLFLIIKV